VDKLAAIAALANGLSPFIPLATMGVDAIVGAIKGAQVAAGVMTDDAADADLRALVVEALAAKAEADRAAAGTDPR
jgi:hypothetical protein